MKPNKYCFILVIRKLEDKIREVLFLVTISVTSVKSVDTGLRIAQQQLRYVLFWIYIHIHKGPEEFFLLLF